MRLGAQGVSDTTVLALAAGEGGADAVAELSAFQRLKNRMLIRGVVTEARSASHPGAALAARAYGLLADLEVEAGEEVERVLRYPAVGAWAWRTYRSLRSGNGTSDDPAQLGAPAVVAAVRARIACRVRLPVRDGAIMLPSLGRLTLPEGVEETVDITVRPDADGAELEAAGLTVRVRPRGDRPGWQALHGLRVTPGFEPVVDDLDPYRWSAKEVAEPRLDPGRLRAWGTHLDDAWRILAAHHATVAEEVRLTVSVLTPVKAPERGQNSATSRETFGTVAMSDPWHGVGLAATFAHEIQHAKLTALTEAIPLTLPDDGSRHYAPWRDDPRPVYGLLQGSYAYLGVAEFWRRQHRFERDAEAFRARVELARWRRAAYAVTGTLLASGGLNERGEEFVARMRKTLEECAAEPVDSAAESQARREAERHLDAWRRRNPGFRANGWPHTGP
ncbi:HEXXH motif domain-containing protein [Streptosporangium sp. NPDC049046]|uniref:HEXXH motif domain-containing protein n=1 Tax=Streptosporangium sp. NPDC049046 TaxID=3155031 RepID=UPI0034351DD5